MASSATSEEASSTSPVVKVKGKVKAKLKVKCQIGRRPEGVLRPLQRPPRETGPAVQTKVAHKVKVKARARVRAGRSSAAWPALFPSC